MNPAPDSFLIGEGQTLVCLGDSITQNDQGYCAMLAVLIAAAYPERRIRVINAGIGGNKAPDMLARLQRDVLSHRPDWVTVNVGINDVWHGLGDPGRGVGLTQYRADLEKIVDRLLAAGARVVLVPPTVIGEDSRSEGNRQLTAYRAAMRDLAAARNLLVAPSDIYMDNALAAGAAQGGEPGKTLTTDGVHLRGPGDAVVAGAILRTLGFFGAGAVKD
jgi:lysophospholipase L1-like esterase